MITSLSGLSPVISRSIQMRLSRLGAGAVCMASAEGAPARKRMRQRAAIDVFKLTADRHPVRDATRAHALRGCDLAEEMGRRLALNRRIGGENELAHTASGENRGELAHAELLRPDPVERR